MERYSHMNVYFAVSRLVAMHSQDTKVLLNSSLVGVVNLKPRLARSWKVPGVWIVSGNPVSVSHSVESYV